MFTIHDHNSFYDLKLNYCSCREDHKNLDHYERATITITFLPQYLLVAVYLVASGLALLDIYSQLRATEQFIQVFGRCRVSLSMTLVSTK